MESVPTVELKANWMSLPVLLERRSSNVTHVISNSALMSYDKNVLN